MAYDHTNGGHRALYDRDRCVEVRMSAGMTEEEAQDYPGFNTDCMHAGPLTPLIVELLLPDEVLPIPEADGA